MNQPAAVADLMLDDASPQQPSHPVSPSTASKTTFYKKITLNTVKVEHYSNQSPICTVHGFRCVLYKPSRRQEDLKTCLVIVTYQIRMGFLVTSRGHIKVLSCHGKVDSLMDRAIPNAIPPSLDRTKECVVVVYIQHTM
jgi:hypothetical protein